jgi:hypothetical protein
MKGRHFRYRRTWEDVILDGQAVIVMAVVCFTVVFFMLYMYQLLGYGRTLSGHTGT